MYLKPTKLIKLKMECKKSHKKPHVGGYKTRTETLWDRGHAHLWTVLKHQFYSGIQNTFLKIPVYKSLRQGWFQHTTSVKAFK